MRVLAGIKPTSDSLHLGNYFGALRQFVDLQDQHSETMYFIADYHSMTTLRDGEQRKGARTAKGHAQRGTPPHPAARGLRAPQRGPASCPTHARAHCIPS